MFQVLRPEAYDRVAPLFRGIDHNLSVRATLAGNNPGEIFVDDPEEPRVALAITVEGAMLAGDYTDPATLRKLRAFLKRFFAGQVLKSVTRLWLDLHPIGWEAKLPYLIPTHQADKISRYFYLCRRVQIDWRKLLPDGYRLQRTDRSLLDDPSVSIPDHLLGWIESAWGDVDRLAVEGAGFCVLFGDEVACWCTADCVAGDRIDIGIRTLPAHRRRGLATVATAATVEDCLRRGFRSVGWHCDHDNLGSWKTAEKVGFKRSGKYFYYYYIFNQADHQAQLGWSAYKRSQYDLTARHFESVFALRKDNPDYYYHLAAAAWAVLGDRQQALEYLEQAVARGWSDFEMTECMDEFSVLHETPQWEMLLSRMRGDV